MKCPADRPAGELQLVAVTCLFMASKNIMLYPFTLQNAVENMCYEKFTYAQFLKKEKEIRMICSYVNETPNFLDFATYFLKSQKF